MLYYYRSVLFFDRLAYSQGDFRRLRRRDSRCTSPYIHWTGVRGYLRQLLLLLLLSLKGPIAEAIFFSAGRLCSPRHHYNNYIII